ncbi:hypothetical protein SH601_10695 [Gracilibacillus sp. S3-1-1]|uniref:Uncharacterized protein n=1 Tax=Gracilibacillus pellucidus TaxID=3095368 RepID=A0ACC6M641_9BACI|nr:hypothetical protein [Gracilibacillus sp. S3-1-1]MDX8046450.1 hypothetical protein [Gracilibacillus sp. S3-1-1]
MIGKAKATKDKLIFTMFMLIAVTLLSLQSLDFPFPYLADLLELATKPVSNPLEQWLQGFQEE